MHRTLLGLGPCRPHRSRLPHRGARHAADETTDTAHDIWPGIRWEAHEGRHSAFSSMVRPVCSALSLHHHRIRGRVRRWPASLGGNSERRARTTSPSGSDKTQNGIHLWMLCGGSLEGDTVVALIAPVQTAAVGPAESDRAGWRARTRAFRDRGRLRHVRRRHGRPVQHFDNWYSAMATSPRRDEIVQRHLGLPAAVLSSSLAAVGRHRRRRRAAAPAGIRDAARPGLWSGRLRARSRRPHGRLVHRRRLLRRSDPPGRTACRAAGARRSLCSSPTSPPPACPQRRSTA